MGKKCHICGEVKKTTFNCSECDEITCLNCYNFIFNQCYDCVTVVYGIKYKIKINDYANGDKIIKVLT